MTIERELQTRVRWAYNPNIPYPNNMTEEVTQSKKLHLPHKTAAIIGTVALLVIATFIALSVYFFGQYKKLSGSSDVGKQEMATILAKVGKLIELPEGEEPTLATVTDEEKLKSQAFFANAKNGDKILVFSVAKKAILYRPSSDKIIEVAPLAQPTPIPPQPVKTVIYNGTKTTGLTTKVEKLLIDFTNVQVIDKSNAKATGYAKTLVIDLTGYNTDLAKNIATTLNAEVGFLPEGENKPEADILIIAGADRTATPSIISTPTPSL